MTGNKSLLTNIQSCSNKSVIFGDSGKGRVREVGTLNVPGMAVLWGVLYVEGLTANLISISQLCDGGMNVSFGRNNCVINEGSEKFLEANRSTENCYIFIPQITGFIVSSRICETWHLHTHYRNIQSQVQLGQLLENSV